MYRPVKFISLPVLICLISLLITIPVMAVPALPSSFYGTLKVNGENVADGTLVQALINDQVVSQAYTQTYQADSVYALDIPGDDADTSVQDGGRENDTINFMIGGALADQTGTWNSGTNINLNLTVTVVGTIPTAQATPSTVPTQTAIVIIQLSPTPTTSPEPILTPSAQPTLTSFAQPTLKATPLNQPSATPGSLNQPSPTSIPPMNPGNGSSNIPLAVVVVGIVIVAAGSAIFALLRRINTGRK